jgi:hypothetical protein
MCWRRMSGFVSRSLDVRFMVNKVAMWQALSWHVSVHCIIPPVQLTASRSDCNLQWPVLTRQLKLRHHFIWPMSVLGYGVFPLARTSTDEPTCYVFCDVVTVCCVFSVAASCCVFSVAASCCVFSVAASCCVSQNKLKLPEDQYNLNNWRCPYNAFFTVRPPAPFLCCAAFSLQLFFCPHCV